HAGNRVKKIENDVTTYYINKYYEVEDDTAIKYYYANGQRIAKNDGGTLTFYHADHLGGSARITNESGTEIRRLGYKPYGEDAYSSGTGDEPYYKFTGKEQDSTGLYYYGARYYDPALGRFISPDAMGDNYVYCNNNPLMYVDPDGNFALPALPSATAVAAFAAKYVVPIAVGGAAVIESYRYACEKGYINENIQSKVNGSVEYIGQSTIVQGLADMGIRFGYESIEAEFTGIAMGSPLSKTGELDVTTFSGHQDRLYLDGGNSTATWINEPSAMYWKGGSLFVGADVNDAKIAFYEKELLPISYLKMILKEDHGIFKIDAGHAHVQYTNTGGENYLSFRPTVGIVSKVNSNPGTKNGVVTVPFIRRGPFMEINLDKLGGWYAEHATHSEKIDRVNYPIWDIFSPEKSNFWK
ncbi:MAG: RHS repeat-associated core domain-containing protein, partial [Desulfobacterales bacterium]|nr:RHS repeat-associated core domain-containing protein [Desulfobacterales bacterium]